MTAADFKTLKVGDRVCVRRREKDHWMDTEVLKVDHLFGKVTILCGRKAYSYRCVRYGMSPTTKRGGLCVGMCSL